MLTNVGMMNKQNVNGIIKQFPPDAIIKKSGLMITVTHPANNKVMMSAVHFGAGRWHVRAVPDLINFSK